MYYFGGEFLIEIEASSPLLLLLLFIIICLYVFHFSTTGGFYTKYVQYV
jgi:hypothetical protein